MTAISPDAEPATRGDLDRLRLELRGELATLRDDIEREIQTRVVPVGWGRCAAGRWGVRLFSRRSGEASGGAWARGLGTHLPDQLARVR